MITRFNIGDYVYVDEDGQFHGQIIEHFVGDEEVLASCFKVERPDGYIFTANPDILSISSRA